MKQILRLPKWHVTCTDVVRIEKIIHMDNFGKRLREERLRIGNTQSEFCIAGGVKVQAQVNYEKGTRKPDAAYLSAIAAGADVSYIITGVRSISSKESLSHREAALMDNYRHCAEGDQAALERLASTGAQSRMVNGDGEKAG